MLQKIGTVAQIKTIKEQLHPDLYQAVLHDLHLLDFAYGTDRDYFSLGGYSIVIDSESDLKELKSIVDFETHFPEEVLLFSSCNYLAALFVINDDFSIMVWLPVSLAPKNFLDEV